MRLRIKELSKIETGTSIPGSLLKETGKYIYLTNDGIDGYVFNSGNNHRYVSHSHYSKLKIKPLVLDNGDFIVHIDSSNKINLIQYNGELNCIVLPSHEMIIIKTDNSYLKNYFGLKRYRNKFLSEISVPDNDLQKILENIFEFSIILEDSPLIEEELEVEDEDTGVIEEERGEMSKSLIPQIIMSNESISIYTIMSRIEDREVNMNTKFQREASLWEDDKKCKLIESILLKFPIPAFYFDTKDNDNWLIIDGLQRLSAIKEFAIDKTLILDNLDFMHDLQDKGWDDLDRKMQRDFMSYNIVTYQNSSQDKLIKYNLFKRINSGSLKLENQEIRHALNQGKPAEVLLRFSRLPAFKEIVQINDNYIRRMKDREIVLRYLAFRITNYTQYTGKIQSFLDLSMEYLGNIADEKIKQWEIDFDHSLRVLYDIFGDHVFRSSLYEDIPQKRRFSIVIYEPWIYSVSCIGFERRNNLKSNKSKIRSIFKGLLSGREDLSSDFTYEFDELFSQSAYSKSRLIERFRVIEDVINRFSK